MVPEKTQNSKTIYIASKTHNSAKTLRNDYNRLLQHRFSYLKPIWSLKCPYRIQESNKGLQDAIQQLQTYISPSSRGKLPVNTCDLLGVSGGERVAGQGASFKALFKALKKGSVFSSMINHGGHTKHDNNEQAHNYLSSLIPYGTTRQYARSLHVPFAWQTSR